MNALKKKFLETYPRKADRVELAQLHCWAWILEYQPEILIPGKGMFPIDIWDNQFEFVSDEESLFRLLIKGRQEGFTTLEAIEESWEFIKVPASQQINISRNLEAGANLHRYFYNALESARKVDPYFPKSITANKLQTINHDTKASVKTLPTSPDAGRSNSASHWRFDEVNFVPYAMEIYQAAAPTVAQSGGRITAWTTPKHRGGLDYEVYQDPESFGARLFIYPWWTCPAYNPVYAEWKAAKTESERAYWVKEARKGKWYQSQLKRFSGNVHRFQQEFECSFDVGAENVFTERQLRKSFSRNYLSRIEDPEMPDMEWWFEKPVSGHYHITGIDLGRKRDPTVVATFDVSVKPARLKEYKRIVPLSADWQEIVLTIRKTYGTFDTDMFCDSSGPGDAVSEMIADIAEPYVFADNQFTKKKTNLVENCRNAMDLGAIEMPKIPQLYREFERYQWNDKKLVQDSVMAVAIAVKEIYSAEAIHLGVDPDFNLTED